MARQPWSATCKPQWNHPFTILKICLKSKSDPNMTIPLFKVLFKLPKRVWILGFVAADARLPSPSTIFKYILCNIRYCVID